MLRLLGTDAVGKNPKTNIRFFYLIKNLINIIRTEMKEGNLS